MTLNNLRLLLLPQIHSMQHKLCTCVYSAHEKYIFRYRRVSGLDTSLRILANVFGVISFGTISQQRDVMNRTESIGMYGNGRSKSDENIL